MPQKCLLGRSLTADNLQDTNARAAESFPPKAKETRDDGWRAIIVQRAIRYFAWRVEECIHCIRIYTGGGGRGGEQRWERGGRKGGESAWYTFNTGPEEPPAQQVHRRWFSSSFSLAGFLSRLLTTAGSAPCVRDLPQWWTTLFFFFLYLYLLFFFFFFYAEGNRSGGSEALPRRPERKDWSAIVAPNAPACLMILMVIDIFSVLSLNFRSRPIPRSVCFSIKLQTRSLRIKVIMY